MPAPTPRMQLMTMSHAMLRANRRPRQLKKKIESPTIRILSLSLPSESFPESSTKGMISSDGSEVSIWISRSVTLGNTLFRSPRIGETASPGSDAMADTDQIASSSTSVIEPFPVLIFMSGILVPLFPQLLYQTKTAGIEAGPPFGFFRSILCQHERERYHSIKSAVRLDQELKGPCRCQNAHCFIFRGVRNKKPALSMRAFSI